MKYSVLRPTLKSGGVIAWSEGGWTNLHDIEVSIVRMITESEFSHVGVVWRPEGSQRVFIVEAVCPLIRIFPLSKLLPFYYLKTPIEWWSSNSEEVLLSRVGQKYSKWDAIKAFFKKDLDGNRTSECAMLVNKTLVEFDAGFNKVLDTPTKVVKYLMDEHSIPLIYVE
jgi:hypothetical protein